MVAVSALVSGLDAELVRLGYKDSTMAQVPRREDVRDCVLLCAFHHQVAIHRRGWTLVLNPDGTTTAWNKDKTKVLRSHGPPARAG